MHSCVARGTHDECVYCILTLFLCAFTGENQVTTFLNHNGGPGVQHVALHTDSIINAVSSLRSNGVQFIKPPPEYYSLV